MKPGQLGARRARILLFIVGGIQIGLLLSALVFKSSSIIGVLSGWLTLPGTLIAAVFLQLRMESEDRRVFWLWTLIGLVAVALIWVTTCGAAFSGIGL